MNRNLIRYMLWLLLVANLGLAPSLASGQQPSNSATSKAQKSRGAPGSKDEHIKHAQQPNDPNAPAVAPPDKGGPKTRGIACRIHIDNRTPWYVDVYTDGDYRGQVSPWGDSYGWVGCGNTNLYGVATFSDGSNLTWGPTVRSVDGTLTWSLTQ
jgi:hypothetical protein